MMHHQMKGKARARNAQKKSLFPLLAFLKYLVVFVTGVYCGTIASFQYNTSSNLECGNVNGNEFIRSQSLNGNTDALELKLRACYTDLMNAKNRVQNKEEAQLLNDPIGPGKTGTKDLFSDATVRKIAAGITQLDRKEFFDRFDFGTPNDGKSNVLMLYHEDRSLPRSHPEFNQMSDSIVPMSWQTQPQIVILCMCIPCQSIKRVCALQWSKIMKIGMCKNG